jgi:hypothetical protein
MSQPFFSALDKSKTELICKTYLKKEIISAFNQACNDMPDADFAISDMDFMATYWKDDEFKAFAIEKFGDLSGKLVEMGDECLAKCQTQIRALFTCEPVTANDYKILELWATPGCKKWFADNLPWMKVSFVNPKQFGLLKL